jgi:hypothetical protein|tara:strand:- start:539 stop:1192 length:654 start_codon:yes stop_codon:yes gene_type:complete
MARTDIFKRIKNNKVIEDRIQKYRLHYDYLKTCLDFPNDFKVDKSKYTHWKLDEVKQLKFNNWWKKTGGNLFSKELEQVKEVKNFKQSNSSAFVEIPLDVPIEYAVEKIRKILQEKQMKIKNNERIRPLELQIYLESFLLKQKGLKLVEIATELRKKRVRILKIHKDKAQMNEDKVDKFLPTHMRYEVVNRIIWRYHTNAKKILLNVCKGEFPGNYS